MSKPLVHYNSMEEITKAEQRKLCRCSTLCKMFVIITYTRGPVLTMCEAETKRYIDEVVRAIGYKGTHFLKGTVRHWTIEEEEKLIAYYKVNRHIHDYAKRLSMEMDRTNRQIFDKVKQLKMKGRIPK